MSYVMKGSGEREGYPARAPAWPSEGQGVEEGAAIMTRDAIEEWNAAKRWKPDQEPPGILTAGTVVRARRRVFDLGDHGPVSAEEGEYGIVVNDANNWPTVRFLGTGRATDVTPAEVEALTAADIESVLEEFIQNDDYDWICAVHELHDILEEVLRQLEIHPGDKLYNMFAAALVKVVYDRRLVDGRVVSVGEEKEPSK